MTFLAVVIYYYFAHNLDTIEAEFSRSRDIYVHRVAKDLMAQASGTAREIDKFLTERLLDTRVWASAPVVIDAARAANNRNVAEGLTTIPMNELESRFRIEKRPDVSPMADAYLHRQVTSSPHIAEVFFTDRNGFNVAFTNPPSDFTQSDEVWWQNAWIDGMAVGEIEFDDSAGVWSIGISVRIDEVGTKTPVGVMKAVLAIEAIERISDWAALGTHGGHVLVATDDGALIAETESGHARERLMNPEINQSEQGIPSVRAAFGSERTGFAIEENWITGYTHTGGPDIDASTNRWFTGLDWIIILKKGVGEINEPLFALHAINNTLRSWRGILAVAIGAMVLLCSVIAITLSLRAAHSYAASLQAIRQLAEHAALGKSISPVLIEHPKEIARLYDAVYHLSQVFMSKI